MAFGRTYPRVDLIATNMATSPRTSSLSTSSAARAHKIAGVRRADGRFHLPDEYSLSGRAALATATSYRGKPMPPKEQHHTQRTGWLRASVLGANDGVMSIASLLLGVAAAHAAHSGIMIAGLSGLVAGAMAAGEYVSVSSQADTEKADLALERKELETNETFEREELAAIYVKRGLDLRLAKEVAEQLMAEDGLAAHARDELGITDTLAAPPFQAALASAISFVVGALLSG
jgi:VIT1/CCC1 family predicted Fe2+/Mn2+ transporter